MELQNDHLLLAQPDPYEVGMVLDDLEDACERRNPDRKVSARNILMTYFNEAYPSWGRRVSPEDFWAWLRIEIDKNGVSMREFAEVVDIPEYTVSKICSKKLLPSDEVLKKLGFVRKEYYVLDENIDHVARSKEKMKECGKATRDRGVKASKAYNLRLKQIVKDYARKDKDTGNGRDSSIECV